ncbi:MAG: twin-arginine translocase TatA/TatE family subunit [Methanosarcinales archaeon Met12]|nr:MAG: twin-arginine translocase TatA/TatE family subunit [Methanosarcinales archaeon Met12]
MIGPHELIIIGVIIILLFGASKIPELARSLGKSVGEFKKAQKESEIKLSEFERSIKDSVTPHEKKDKVHKMAKGLGIETEGKTEDELLDEVQDILSKREHVEN